MKVLWILFLAGVSLGLLLVSCSTDEPLGPDAKNDISKYKLIINEFMASNDAAVSDPEDNGAGDNSPFDDWFEIYNADSVPVNIGGMYVTDALDDLKKWQIPTTDPAKTTIPPRGFLVIWADSEPEQGVLHANFALSGGGESIAIVESNGRLIINSYTYAAQQTDFSFGRDPDGSENWKIFSRATPGKSNTGASANMPPTISNVKVQPDTIKATDMVTVSAEVKDPNLDKVVLTYGAAANLTNTAAMTLNGTIYQAQVGPFMDGSVIYYFITANDLEAAESKTDTLYFEVGYVAPVLFINELLASNNSSFKDPEEDAQDGDPQDDWFEIYNPNSDSIDVGGMYVTDKLSNLTMWQIPKTNPKKTRIPGYGFIIIWADKEMQQGPLHVDLKLSGSGEQIGLIAPNGTTVIDSLTFGPQASDISFGRKPDGSKNWTTFTAPTPGGSNN
ncbi:lamin tail domain-containing protein [candidate division KSB1 bacterium]|nr:lamin tail domain-containing protein [candidate division KSB1 bacterium]